MSELKCHWNIWWNSFPDASDSKPITGSCSTDYIGFESGPIKGALKMLLKSVPTSGDSFPNECDLVCPRKLICIRLDAQFHTFRYSYEHSGLDLQLACISVIPLRSVCLWQVTSGPYFWNPRSKSLEIFSSCLTAFFLFGFSSIGWSETPCPGKQPELNSFLYVKKDNGNYLRGTAYGKNFQEKPGYQIFSSKILLPCKGDC